MVSDVQKLWSWCLMWELVEHFSWNVSTAQPGRVYPAGTVCQRFIATTSGLKQNFHWISKPCITMWKQSLNTHSKVDTGWYKVAFTNWHEDWISKVIFLQELGPPSAFIYICKISECPLSQVILSAVAMIDIIRETLVDILGDRAVSHGNILASSWDVLITIKYHNSWLVMVL